MKFRACCGPAPAASPIAASAGALAIAVATSAPQRTRRAAAGTQGDAGDDDTRYAVLTVGHSTRPIEAFVDLLRGHDVTRLIDVRTVPRSRHNPQFATDALAASMQSAGIGYAHVAGLGGFRRPLADSPNAGWRNLSFRGYADYMQTPAFRAELDHLIELAAHARLALMCAEAVPWRCHRSLIADALLARGVASAEIASATRLQRHRLTRFARIDGDRVTYPADAAAAIEPTSGA
ncbi:DUF488 family protein [Piscinibacter koreensis]|uniref:DUF488 domain-containing protein n=1 Tax=Piscinibacter koreensis TaxID=2742824 RepID=A0A7Y6NMV4_9BURK|nr:DUF488 domain-containing protein [Schlegelella koreensis]NUZ06075.1 DUF488 domain-containing protein [Schlegelella koreensis]